MDAVTIDLRPLAEELGRPLQHIEAAVALLDAGNTVPFIARYRKEQTGGMDDAQLRALAEGVAKARALEERRADVLRLLAEHGHLTPELEQEVRAATTQQRLEDLYRPYRPKRRTRASVAKERVLSLWLSGYWRGPGAIRPPRRRNTSARKCPMQKRRCKAHETSSRRCSATMLPCASGCGACSGSRHRCGRRCWKASVRRSTRRTRTTWSRCGAFRRTACWL